MKVVRNSLLSLVATLLVSVAAQAASVVGTWSVNANGTTGTMTISTQDAAGNVTGTFLGNSMKGFWNDSAGRLTFYRAVGGTTQSTPPDKIQIYTAYLHPLSASNPNGTQVLDGYFEGFAGTGATAVKNLVGWTATK